LDLIELFSLGIEYIAVFRHRTFVRGIIGCEIFGFIAFVLLAAGISGQCKQWI
jgi:hypothetical protein